MTHEPTPIGTVEPPPMDTVEDLLDEPKTSTELHPVKVITVSTNSNAMPVAAPQPAIDDFVVTRWTWGDVFSSGFFVGFMSMFAASLLFVCLQQSYWHKHYDKLHDVFKETATKLAALEARYGKR